MTTIQNTSTLAAPATATTSSRASNASAAEIENRFLTLLVSQLRNQDPLSPMDNAQLTTQLAQISTVSGVDRLNATMSALASSLGASQSMQASGLVGHDVMVAGSDLPLAQGKAQGGFSLAQAADDVRVTIRDASGKIVRTQTLGAQPTGSGRFTWDGQTDAGTAAADGHYTFEVTALAGTGTVTAQTLMVGKVLGVIPGTNGAPTQLQIGALGRFDLSQIVEIN
jgi:flagellar basal-body rod modification protein FlgD